MIVFVQYASSGDLPCCRNEKKIIKRCIHPSNKHMIATTFIKDYPVSGEVCLRNGHGIANLLQDVKPMGL